ncbi:MAG: RNA polymerase sigma factor [Planctomycetales bacterium]|nr:RNA polymerase sigma factor [Planctomycetales bacterium]
MSTATSPPCTFDLAALVTEHQRDIWRYLRYLGASREDADDLTQDTFLVVARSDFQPRSRGETAAYLRTAARNRLLMQRRTEGRRISTVALTAADEVWASYAPEGRSESLVEQLGQCVEGLEGRARSAVAAFYVEGLSREQLAGRLQMTVDGVKTLLRRTRQALRSCIERTLHQ